MYVDLALRSKIVQAMPRHVASPFAVPTGFVNPPGKGLASWMSLSGREQMQVQQLAAEMAIENRLSGVSGRMIYILKIIR